MPATNGAHVIQIHPKLNRDNAQRLCPLQQGKGLSQLSAGLLGPKGCVERGGGSLPPCWYPGEMRDLLNKQALWQALTWRGGRISFRANCGAMGAAGKWEFPSKPVPVLMGSPPSWLSNTRPTDCSFCPQWQALSRAI